MNLKNLVYGAGLAVSLAANGCAMEQNDDQEQCRITTDTTIFYNESEVRDRCDWAGKDEEISCLVEDTRGQLVKYNVVCGYDDLTENSIKDAFNKGGYAACSPGQINYICR